MLLKRGHLLLIAGGAAIAVSLSALGYYGMQLVDSLEAEEKQIVAPRASVEIRRNISAGFGAYVASFPDFTGGSPQISIKDPTGNVILESSAGPPISMEAFLAEQSGVYSLTLSNPSSDLPLEASILLDRRELVLNKAGSLSPELTAALGLVLVIGAAAAVSGAVITFMDRRRLSKMKQYGDTSDLV